MGVGRFSAQAVIEQEHEQEQEQEKEKDFISKKLPPPTPERA
jgi:hypothetical protein